MIFHFHLATGSKNLGERRRRRRQIGRVAATNEQARTAGREHGHPTTTPATPTAPPPSEVRDEGKQPRECAASLPGQPSSAPGVGLLPSRGMGVGWRTRPRGSTRCSRQRGEGWPTFAPDPPNSPCRSARFPHQTSRVPPSRPASAHVHRLPALSLRPTIRVPIIPDKPPFYSARWD